MKTMEVFTRWNEILSEVEKEDKSLAFCLRKGFLSDISGRKVIIEFDDFDKFHKRIAEKRIDVIEKAVSKVLDKRMNIEFVLVDNPEGEGRLPF